MKEKKHYKQKPRKCSSCGSNTIATILYGMPAFSDELQKDLADGKIVLGGCCIENDSPTWQCAECEQEFWKI